MEGNGYILFSPGTPHYYRHLETPFVNDWFHCEGDGMAKLLRGLNFPSDKLIQPADPSMISRHIMGMQQVIREGGSLMEQILDLELRSIFMKLSNSRIDVPDTDKAGRYFHLFSRLRNELYGSPYSRVSVAELAARVNLSKSYFQHMYKELFGCSVMFDMINGRLEYAKYLLAHTQLPVAEIAKLCGYENETHFMRQFKKFVGVTPTRYKTGGS